jgi:hypothetical protein
MGTLEKADLPEDLRDVLFSLEKNESFGPFHTDGKFVIFVVTDVIDAKDETHVVSDEQREEVIEDIKARKALQSIDDMKNKIEDSLASGETLENVECADKKVFKVVFSADSAEEILDGYKLDKEMIDFIRSRAFELDEGFDSSFADFSGKSIIVRVVKIIPRHFPDFEIIREYAKEDLVKERKQSAEGEWLQNVFAEALNDPKKWSSIAKQNKCNVKVVKVSLYELLSDQNAYSELFSVSQLRNMMLLRKNQIDFRQTNDGTVVAIRANKPKKDTAMALNASKREGLDKVRANIEGALMNDIVKLVAQSIRATCKVKVNQKSIDHVRRVSGDE